MAATISAVSEEVKGPVSPKKQEKKLYCYCLSEGNDGEFMIECDGCANWYHGRCIDPSMVEEDTQYLSKFYCRECQPKFGKSVFKEPTRKSKRDKTQINYNELNEGGAAVEEDRFTKTLQARTFRQESFQRVRGDELTLEWLRKSGFREPVLVTTPEGLDMAMPSKDLIVDQVADMCGRDRKVDAIEVSTQSERIMTLDEWAKYFHQPPEKRKRIMNVISLEISQTPLAEQVKRPRVVRDLDWTDNVWPSELKRAGEYPHVQLYCLMSVKDSYTDFHIDFGGSSVFYHLLSGEKVFYFIPPTSTNLKKYEKWSSSPDQGHTFLADDIRDGAIEVHLKAGNTMMIPTGWIHAVYTPEDSIVIGGNFLHGLNIDGQLNIYEIEKRTNVPAKFRYPYFEMMQWYAARKYMKIVKNALEVLSPWEVKGLDALLTFLKGISEKIHGGTTKAEDRRNLKRSVPKGLKNIDNLLRKFTQHMNRARSKRVEGKDLIPMSRVDTPSHASSETSSVVVSGGGEVDQKPPASTEQQDMDVPTPSGVPTTLLELAQPISDSEDSDDGEKNGGGGPLDDADDSSDWDDGSDDDEDSEDMYGGNTTDSADEDAHAYIPGKFKKKRPMTTRKRKLEADVEKTSMAAEDKSVGGTPPATVAAPAKRRKKSSTAAAAAAATPDPPMAGNALKTSLQGRGASSASPLPHPVDPQQKTEEAVASGKEKDRVASATLPATATVRGGSVASGARQESKEIGVKIAFTPQLPSDAPAWVTGHAPHQPLNVPARHVPGGSAAQPLGLGQAPGEPQTAPVVTSTTPRAPTAASTKLPQFKSVAATSAQQRQSPNTLQFQPLAAAPQQRPAFKPSNMNGSSPSGNLMSGLPPFLMPLPGAAPTSYIPPAPASASAPNPLFVPDPIPPPPPRSASASTSAALPFPYWAFAPNVGGGEASAPNNAASLPPFLGCMAPAPSSSTMIPFPIMGAFAPDAMASGGPYLVQQQAQLPPHQELAFPVYHPHEQPLLLANHLEQFQQQQMHFDAASSALLSQLGQLGQGQTQPLLSSIPQQQVVPQQQPQNGHHVQLQPPPPPPPQQQSQQHQQFAPPAPTVPLTSLQAVLQRQQMAMYSQQQESSQSQDPTQIPSQSQQLVPLQQQQPQQPQSSSQIAAKEKKKPANVHQRLSKKLNMLGKRKL